MNEVNNNAQKNVRIADQARLNIMEKRRYENSGFDAYNVVGPSSGKKNIIALQDVSIGSNSGLPKVAPLIYFAGYLGTVGLNSMLLKITGWDKRLMKKVTTAESAM
jgi:hypothetical protein